MDTTKKPAVITWLGCALCTVGLLTAIQFRVVDETAGVSVRVVGFHIFPVPLLYLLVGGQIAAARSASWLSHFVCLAIAALWCVLVIVLLATRSIDPQDAQLYFWEIHGMPTLTWTVATSLLALHVAGVAVLLRRDVRTALRAPAPEEAA